MADAQDQLRAGPHARAFLVPRPGGGPGVHPLDVALDLTRDTYTPLVIGWFCRLATREGKTTRPEIWGDSATWML